MIAPLRLRLLDHEFAVHWEEGVSEEQVDELRRAWSRCLSDSVEDLPPPSPDERPLLAADRTFRATAVSAGGRFARVGSTTFEELASHLTSSLTVEAISARTGELMMLHASGLADPETGMALALVARSGMGKTTATRNLARHFGYLTDETVAVDRGGRFVPYPKPLSVIVNPLPEPKHQIGPDELELQPAPESAILRAVVLLDRNDEVAEAVAEPVPLVDAIVELTPQTSALASLERPLQWLCELLDSCGGAVRVSYQESAELEPLLSSLLRRPPLEQRTWWWEGKEPAEGELPEGSYRRVAVVDAVGVEGELLVLRGHTVTRLAGIAPVIWAATREAVSREGLIAALEAEIGLPEGYEPLLEAALEELVKHDLLEIG